MQCPRCNTPLEDEARFCGICGTPISVQGAAGQQAQPLHNDLTLAEPAWPQRQEPQTPLVLQHPQWSGGTSQPTQGVAWQQPPVQAGWSAPNQLQSAPWPQQPVQGGWPPMNQPQVAYPPVAPGASKRRRKWPMRVLLVSLILLILLTGSWFLGVRPYLNNLAKTQITQSLGEAQNEVSLLQSTFPDGPATLTVTETELNQYLSAHAGSQLQNPHMTITPADLQMDFKVNGFSCTMIAVPVVFDGALQVTNVQTQGWLGLVLSGDELTTILNTFLQNVGQQMHRHVDSVSLHNQMMVIQVS